MPSSYTLSCRFTLQATGENNNTWGVILNNGVFGLVDYAIAGRLAFALSGTKTLTTALGATDEARVAFLDVTGGSGGQIVVPAVSKGYFVRNAASGAVSISAGGAVSAALGPGDVQPVFGDGANVYPLRIAGLGLQDFINAAISAAGSAALPSPLGNAGKALMVVNVPPETWLPRLIQQSDVQGLSTTLTNQTAQAIAFAVAL